MLETLTILSVLAVHRPFYISICISTLPTQNTTFISILDLSLLDLSPLRPMTNLKKFRHSLRHEMVSHLFWFLTTISKLALRLPPTYSFRASASLTDRL